MKSNSWHERIVPVFIALATTLLFVFAIVSNGVGDPGDGVMHHLIAKYSWKHPRLFLDHWGKPLYTLLSSPFAQFGYKGSVIFNILCTAVTAYLSWKIALRLKMRVAWLAPLLVFFTPIALPTYMSGLTEPLFALVLTTSLFFLFSGRAGLSAIIISFLPFARTEGFFLIPVFILLFLVRRDLTAAFLTGTATVIFSISGWISKGDLLWIVHENPYKGALSLYGHGGLFDFIAANEFIWGWALSFLLITGIIHYYIHAFRTKGYSDPEFILLPTIFLVFLVLHSVFWWKGLFGSLGLHRVMHCTVPIAALIALRGIELIGKYGGRIAFSTAITLTVFLQIFLTLRQHPLPIRVLDHEKILITAVDGIKNFIHPETKLMCDYPMVAMLTGKDPFDGNQWCGVTTTTSDLKKGDLVIWDSHFTMMQKNTSPGELKKNKDFVELGRFGEIPASPNDRNSKFAVVIFQFTGSEK